MKTPDSPPPPWESIAQVAYEEYNSELPGLEWCPPWDQLSSNRKRRWLAAVQKAVAKYNLDRAIKQMATEQAKEKTKGNGN
jgi:hypothetical protein